MVAPSRRKEAAQKHRQVSIRLVCAALGISESFYHYQPKLGGENEVIADWLIRLTTAQCNWGFGLCFAYLRIKPRRRLVRERLVALGTATDIN